MMTIRVHLRNVPLSGTCYFSAFLVWGSGFIISGCRFLWPCVDNLLQAVSTELTWAVSLYVGCYFSTLILA